MNRRSRQLPATLGFATERELLARYPGLGARPGTSRSAPSLLALLVIVVLWYAATEVFGVSAYILPAPHVVLGSLVDNFAMITRHLGVTIFEAMSGLALAVVLGFAVSFLIVWSPALGRAILPILAFIQTTPKVAVAPLLLLWLGFGYAPKIVIAFLISFFPVVIATVTGLNSAQKELLELVQSLTRSSSVVFWRVRVPSAMPFFFSGLKVAVTLSLIGALVGEYVGSDRGLGYLIMVANGDLNAPLLLAGVVVTALMGFTLFTAVQIIERAVMPWHASVKGKGPTLDERA